MSKNYVLTEQELADLHAKYGKPGELAPGVAAPRKPPQYGNYSAQAQKVRREAAKRDAATRASDDGKRKENVPVVD